VTKLFDADGVLLCTKDGFEEEEGSGIVRRREEEKKGRTDVRFVVKIVVVENDLQQPVQQAEVRSRPHSEMDTAVLDGSVSDRGPARVHDDEERRFRTGKTVEDATPENGLRRRHVVTNL
jgi:hypothetical protein